MINVLVTGSGGQLAECLAKVAPEYPKLKLVYLPYNELDVTNEKQIATVFNDETPFAYCINCAAYTQVDQAENEEEKAYLVNAVAPGLLAKKCKDLGIVLIHISTDFVFSGTKNEPYTEQDKADPIGVYGKTKLAGEQQVLEVLDQFFIIRTSWLYSEFGNNFVKTMLRLAHERTSLSVVNDQLGSPTYGVDLARSILKIISCKSDNYGIYHYSNKGVISWFDFAQKVFDLSRLEIDLIPIKTEDYKSTASRPMYSVLDTTKIQNSFFFEIFNWEDRLKEALMSIDEAANNPK